MNTKAHERIVNLTVHAPNMNAPEDRTFKTQVYDCSGGKVIDKGTKDTKFQYGDYVAFDTGLDTVCHNKGWVVGYEDDLGGYILQHDENRGYINGWFGEDQVTLIERPARLPKKLAPKMLDGKMVGKNWPKDFDTKTGQAKPEKKTIHDYSKYTSKAPYVDVYGDKVEPQTELAKKLVQRIRAVCGPALIKIQRGNEDFHGSATVRVWFELFIPSEASLTHQFQPGVTNKAYTIECQVTTDGFGILVQECYQNMTMSAGGKGANMMMAHLNNPDWGEYRWWREHGKFLPL